MAKRRRKRTLSKTNNAKATQPIQEIKTEEEKKQEVADELCNRMLGKEEKNSEKTKENLIEENTIEKEIINQEENTVDDLLEINEESYEVPQETITTKYSPEDMSDIETFSGIVELVNKIYSSNVSKEEFDIAAETYDNTKEIYTDAAFNFPEGIKIALCKGLEFLGRNKVSISAILAIVKEILSMEKAMLKCKVNVNEDGDIKVDVNVEDAGQEKTNEEKEENKTEDVNQEETKEQKKKEFKDPFEGMDNPSLRLLRLICGIEK